MTANHSVDHCQTPSRRQFLQSASCLSAMALTPHAFPSARDRIRVGQIGTTHPHAAGKLASVRELSDTFEVVGVVESDDGQWQRVQNQPAYKGVPRVTEQQLLNRSDVPAVLVETTVKRLVPTALRCIKAGKHIHLDKPAGESMAACRELHAEADRRKRTIQMGYMLRYNPAFQFLFEAVRKGWLGEITELDAAMGKKASNALRQELSQFRGGGMFELACHLIDATVTVLGRPDKVTAHNRRLRPWKDQMLDNQLAVFDYPNAIATIRCNHADPFGFARRHFGVVGTEGHMQIGPIEPPVAKLSLDRQRKTSRADYRKGTQQLKLTRSSGRYDDEFRDLARVIRGEKKLAWDSKHDLVVHECVLRAGGVELD